ncbi:MAG TPA: GspH/FimT family pseudopilin [Candidatus Acidoferrales bacterium]|nr:GspH/FimT family pseudopilin [Candidatus Acidoferrales bacterium]
MNGLGRQSRVESRVPVTGAKGASCPRPSAFDPRLPGFTLIELVLVLALVVVITSLAAPAMSNFIRGQALSSEARRMVALIHAGQERAVSEGLPMVLWVDEKQGAYGLQAEVTGRNGDPKAETLSLDGNLQVTVVSTGLTGTTKWGGFPAIRFLPDGTVDENSPQELRLTDAKGNTLRLIESRNRNDYEIRDTEK